MSAVELEVRSFDANRSGQNWRTTRVVVDEDLSLKFKHNQIAQGDAGTAAVAMILNIDGYEGLNRVDLEPASGTSLRDTLEQAAEAIQLALLALDGVSPR